MKSSLIVIILVGLLAGFACAPKTPVKTTKKAEIEEDLSGFRPQYEVPGSSAEPNQMNIPRAGNYPEPTYDLTSDINTLLDTISAKNQKVNWVQGYTIVIRGGQLEEARTIRQRVMNLFPRENPELAFDRPIYKVKVGRFFTKIEANKLYSMIKKEFPNRVILAPETIYLY